MRELRLLQTERALANPNCTPPLADTQKIQRFAKRNAPAAAAAENPQTQSNQECAKRNPPPPAHPPNVGRNSLCPCGSGKKFKRCCGPNAAPSSMPPNKFNSLRNEMASAAAKTYDDVRH